MSDNSERLEQAVAELVANPERLEAAQRRIAPLAADLQRVLAQALAEGGWFSSAQQAELRKAAVQTDLEVRIRELALLMAEETRLAMMVGAAVGFDLAAQIDLDKE